VDYLKEAVKVNTEYHMDVPVGAVEDYIYLDESETAKLLYRRLNRNSTQGNFIGIEKCTEIAADIQANLQKKYLTEMAKINPGLHKQIMAQDGFIYVSVPQGNEGPIPHIHVYHTKSLNTKECSFIRLDKAEYSEHHDIIRLPERLQASFLKIMESTWPKYNVTEKNGTIRHATGYEAAVDTWIDTHDIAPGISFKKDPETGVWIMPSYRELFRRKRM
jgi:hypothetical protein